MYCAGAGMREAGGVRGSDVGEGNGLLEVGRRCTSVRVNEAGGVGRSDVGEAGGVGGSDVGEDDGHLQPITQMVARLRVRGECV